MFTVGKLKTHTNWHGVFAVATYTAIKLTAFVCATIIAINVHWLLGSVLFAFALLVRFEFYSNPKLESGLTKRVPDGADSVREDGIYNVEWVDADTIRLTPRR